MFSNATTAWDYVDDCVFVAFRKGPLVDADFEHFIEDVLSKTVKRVVVRAADGSPRANHRATLLRWYSANSARGAVLTDSMLARGGVTALSWFGVAISAFPPDQLDQALDFVEIPRERLQHARAMMSRVISTVDRADPRAASPP